MLRFRFHIVGLLAVVITVASSFSVAAQGEWALVKTSVTSLRTEPRHSAEMSTQVGMGTPLKLIEKSGAWWKVQLPDEYMGYVPANTIQLLTQSEFNEWRKSSRVFIDALETELADEGTIISDLLCGNVLVCDNQRVFTPDGRGGSISTAAGYSPFVKGTPIDFNADKIIETAFSMLGRVYLWGGTSPKMVDCSGLVKVCFLAQGIIVRRDASQQAKTGKAISDISQARKGDLLFFGTKKGKVNHVGIYIGDNKYIHCSGQVKINSLNSCDEDYLDNHLICIRRIGTMIGTDGIWSIYNHPWYFID